MDVEGEMVEPVAEVFSRYAPGGVAIESVKGLAGRPTAETGVESPVRVTCYLKKNHEVEEVKQKLEENLWFLSRIRPLPKPVYRQVHEEDWANAWKDHFHPIKIGNNLIISPAWNRKNPDGRIQIIMDPGMAFGTGAHPSTRLCLELIEELLDGQLRSEDQLSGGNPPAGFDIFDIGCGSGILAIAALKLGASKAFCVDIDATAVESARENAQINAVADRMFVCEGSLKDIKEMPSNPENNRLILVNILAPVLTDLLEQGLAGLVEKGSFLVMSGIIADQMDGIVKTAEEKGLLVRKQRVSGDWVALCAQKGTAPK